MSKSKKCLVVVFWNQDDFNRAATTVHVLDGEPEPAWLMEARPQGYSPTDFLKMLGMEFREAQKLFPRCFAAYDEEKQISWDDPEPLKYQSLPLDKEGMQKLADLVKMPVIAFQYSRGIHQVPERWRQIQPTTI